MSRIKKILYNPRVILLFFFIVLSVYLISPQFSEGVSIRGVVKDSAASQAEPQPMLPPGATIKPTGREIIKLVNGQPITTVEDYYNAVSNLEVNQTVTIKTNKQTYYLTTKPQILTKTLSKTETVEVTKAIFNETINSTQNITINETRNQTIEEVIGVEDLGLSIYTKPSSNIQQGLDLQGGTRVLLEPETEINPEDLDIVLENIKQRLDVYGVNDVTVRTTKDFFGNTFISVEIAGVNEEEVKSLLTEQGKFEAKVGEDTVFEGGNRDVLYVCRTATCSSVDHDACVAVSQEETMCRFRFSITLSQVAAEQQAAATANLGIIDIGIGGGGEGYLTENLSLYLDDELVDQLRIGASLKGNAVTDIQISGSGVGPDKESARTNALSDMRRLQTILITGSLPVKLDIVKTDTISPALGASFIKNAIFAGLIAILVVIAIVAFRYKEWKVSMPMALTMLAEVIIILGFAAMIGWKIDMVAIAAIIIAIGSGVDDQIVITDETLAQGRKKNENYDWKQKLKKAFFIIMASYFTLVVAMIPLWFAGAGLLKGFALTTIAGVTIGVLITRPAFAVILEKLVE